MYCIGRFRYFYTYWPSTFFNEFFIKPLSIDTLIFTTFTWRIENVFVLNIGIKYCHGNTLKLALKTSLKVDTAIFWDRIVSGSEILCMETVSYWIHIESYWIFDLLIHKMTFVAAGFNFIPYMLKHFLQKQFLGYVM